MDPLPNTNKHYFIRHAHRPEFEKGDWGHDVSITQEGKKAACEAGRLIANSQIKTIWTSPIARCTQTAEELREGMCSKSPICHSHLLGDPGFMISDPQVAGKAFQEYEIGGLIDLILEGKPIPGFYSLDIGCRKMLSELIKRRFSSLIWISHDSLICLLGCWIFEQSSSKEMMPGFLEGIEFSFTEEEIKASYKGLSAMIDETSLSRVVERQT